jgi:hypothetical protein
VRDNPPVGENGGEQLSEIPISELITVFETANGRE